MASSHFKRAYALRGGSSVFFVSSLDVEGDGCTASAARNESKSSGEVKSEWGSSLVVLRSGNNGSDAAAPRASRVFRFSDKIPREIRSAKAEIVLEGGQPSAFGIMAPSAT